MTPEQVWDRFVEAAWRRRRMVTPSPTNPSRLNLLAMIAVVEASRWLVQLSDPNRRSVAIANRAVDAGLRVVVSPGGVPVDPAIVVELWAVRSDAFALVRDAGLPPVVVDLVSGVGWMMVAAVHLANDRLDDANMAGKMLIDALLRVSILTGHSPLAITGLVRELAR